MKIVVDKMPTEARECIFSNIVTGKYRCRHNALLCPIARGGECQFLTECPSSPVPEETAPEVKPKNRTTKRSTAKKSE